MKRKFEPGDKFSKLRHAGFVGELLPYCQIDPETAVSDIVPCFECDDPDCREYPNCWVLDAAGMPIGVIYHVSECQMGEPSR